MTLTRATIETMIPHAGTMVLLDEALHWDADHITCLSSITHANPLRRAGGTLGAASGIEIAAQAMALHGHLTAAPGAAPTSGLLVTLRDLKLATSSLEGVLHITATRLRGDAAGATYGFAITAEGVSVLTGRATVLFGSET